MSPPRLPGTGSLIATVASALAAFLAISALVFQLGSRAREMEKQSADIGDIRLVVGPIPAQVSALSAQVSALDIRVARVERCLDAHMQQAGEYRAQ